MSFTEVKLDKQTLKWWLLAFFVIGFVIYINSFGNQMFWDDQDSIINNIYIKDWSYLPKFFSQNLIAGASLVSNYWRPFLLFVFSLEWHFWSSWLPGWHMVNTILHIANAFVLSLFLYKLTNNKKLSFFTALIFLVHPIQTEAITYIAGAADPLYFFCAILSLYYFIKWREDAYKTDKFVRLSMVYFILALMSKEIAIVLPGLVWLVEFYYWLKDEPRIKILDAIKHWLRRLWVYGLIAGIYVLLRATTLNFENTFNLYNEATYYTTHFSARLYTFLKVIPDYFKIMFWPFNQHMERVVDMAVSITEWQVVLGLTIVSVLIYLAWHFRKKDPLITFGVLWFFIGLSIVSNIFAPISGFMYEHWLYLPLIGIFLIVFKLISKIKHNDKYHYLTLVAVILTLFFSLLTVARNLVWRDPITFYNDIIKYNSASLRVWNNLGMAYSEVGDSDKAIQAYKMAMALDSKKQSATPLHNIANLYRQMGQKDLSIKYYERALGIDNRFIFSYLALAQLYYDYKDLPKAKETLERALVYYPDDARIRQLVQYLTQQIQNAQ